MTQKWTRNRVPNLNLSFIHLTVHWQIFCTPFRTLQYLEDVLHKLLQFVKWKKYRREIKIRFLWNIWWSLTILTKGGWWNPSPPLPQIHMNSAWWMGHKIVWLCMSYPYSNYKMYQKKCFTMNFVFAISQHFSIKTFSIVLDGDINLTQCDRQVA